MSENRTWVEERLRAIGAGRFVREPRGGLSGNRTWELIDRAGSRLEELGIAEGELVGIVTERASSCILTLFAMWSRGIVAFPLPRREVDSRVGELVRIHGCRLLLTSRPLPLPDIAQVSCDALLGKEAPEVQLADQAPRQIPGAATALLTSGTSGPRKLVVHGLAQHLASARGAMDKLRFAEPDTWMLTLPLSHVGGMAPIFRALEAGASLAIPDANATLAASLEHFQPSHVSVVGTQLVRLLSDEKSVRTLGHCKTVLAGGGPLPVPLRRWALNDGIPLIVSYGSTESASLVTAETEPTRMLEESNAGRVLPGRRLVVEADGHIRVGGDTLMTGYLTESGLVDPRGDDGLFATGDLGHLDMSGCLFVSGRADSMFISGGENIHPEEIEDAILQVRGVTQAVVVPIPHPEYGERPAAFVRSQPGADVTGSLLARELGRQLPSYKIPDQFWLMPKDGTDPDRERGRLRRLANDPGQSAQLQPI